MEPNTKVKELQDDAKKKLAAAFEATGIFLRGMVAVVKPTKSGKFMFSIVAGQTMLPVVSELSDAMMGESIDWEITIFPTEKGYMASRVIAAV
jgi:hypothetical protein